MSDAYSISSGLPLDDADVTIVACEFGFNAKIGAGKVCANMTFQTDDGEDHEQSLSMGEGWVIEGKGASVTGRKSLNNRTNYGRFVVSMIEAIGGVEKMVATFPKGFMHADNFVGSRWHLGTTPIETMNPETKKTSVKDAMVATAFLGMADGATAAGTAGKAAGTTKATGGKKTLADTNPDLYGRLLELAGEHDEHDSFMEAAMSLPEVEGDSVALNAVMSPTKAGSIWAAKMAG